MQTAWLLDTAGPIKIPNIECSSSKRYGVNISCIYCATTEFNNKFKATAHYVLGHGLKYCSVCCDLFGNDMDKITHENKQHWPFQCTKCYAEYTNPMILKDHYRTSHSMVTCSYCDAVLSPSKDGTLIEHLKSKHSVEQLNGDLAPTVIWTLSKKPGDDVIVDNVKKFHCHLCMQDKLLGSLVSHYQLGHKIDLQKFLDFAVKSSDKILVFIDNALIEANAINKKRSSRSVATAKTLKKIKNSSLNKMVSTICNFMLVKKKSSSEAADSTLIPTYDYDTNLVQCIASSEEEDETSLSDKECQYKDRVSPFTCQYCLIALPTFRSLCQHMQKLHGFQLKNTENRCHPCRKVYSTLSSLQKHRKKMHESATQPLNPIKCPFCEEEHDSRIQMRTHIRQHIEMQHPCKMDSVAFFCKFCPQRFWTIEQKNVHQLSRHITEIQDDFILCCECGVTFSSKTAIRLHTTEAHPKETQIGHLLFKCEICKIANGQLAILRTHMLKVHPAKRRAFCQVEQCKALVVDWELHTRMYHKEHLRTEYEYKCKVCAKIVEGTEIAADQHWETFHGVDL